MENIVFINACVRLESRTYALAKEIIKQLDGIVEEVNLEKEGIAPLNQNSLKERDIYVKKKDFSAPMLRYAKQFMEADKILIAAPYWDLSFPSTLRIYFEAITISGLSFTYTNAGNPKGLCNAKKLIYVTTAGGAIADMNLGYDYVKALAQTFYEIPEVLCFKVENLDIVGADVEKIMKKAIEEIHSNKKLFNE